MALISTNIFTSLLSSPSLALEPNLDQDLVQCSDVFSQYLLR